MADRRFSRKALSILIIASILGSIAWAEASPQQGELYVLDPTYALTQILRPGDVFNITIVDPQGLIASARPGAGLACEGRVLRSYRAEVLGVSRSGSLSIVTARIPSNLEAPERLTPCSLSLELQDIVLESFKSIYILNGSLERLRVMHISDTHLLLPTPVGTSYHTLLSAVFLANIMDVDLVINTGDVGDRPGETSQYDYHVKALSLLRKPVLTVPGNHDGSGIPGDLFLRVYGSLVGSPTWYRLVDGKYLLIGLDSSSLGVVDRSQIEAARSILSMYSGVGAKVVAFHHPLWSGSSRGSRISGSPEEAVRGPLYSSWAQSRDLALELLKLVREFSVSAVLSGHIHQDAITYYGSTVFITTGTLGGPRSFYNSFRIIDIYPNGTVVPFIAPGAGLSDVMNSYNIEGYIFRHFEGPGASALMINISPAALTLLPQSLKIRIPVPQGVEKPAVDLVDLASGASKAVEPSRVVELLGGRRALEISIGLRDLQGPVSLVIKPQGQGADTSPPKIVSTRLEPRSPRQGDIVSVEVAAQDRETFAIAAWASLKALDSLGRPVLERIIDMRPDVSGNRFFIAIEPLNASRLEINITVIDAYGNRASWGTSLEYVQKTPAQATSTAPATTTTAMTSPWVTTATTQTAPAAIATVVTTTTTALVTPARATTTEGSAGPGGPGSSSIWLSALIAAASGAAVALIAIALLRRRS